MEEKTKEEFKVELLQLIKKYDYVSFVDINKRIPESEGNQMFGNSKYPTIIFWHSLSVNCADALVELINERKIIMTPSSFAVYLCDGCVLKFPIAKRLYNYKKEHWLPITFRASPEERAKITDADQDRWMNEVLNENL